MSSILYHGRSEKPDAVASIGVSSDSGVNITFVSDFDTFLSSCDFVIVTCALTPETRNLFDARAFAKMKKDAIFVNTSRGGLVDQKALYEALKNGQIGKGCGNGKEF